MQYGRFARYYDAMMHDVDREAWADYLDALRGGSTQTMRDWAAEQRQAKPNAFEDG